MLYLSVWALVAAAVLLSALLIYLESEWGIILGVTTGVVICIYYFVIGPIAQFTEIGAAAIILMLLLAFALGYFSLRKAWQKLGRPDANTRHDQRSH
jgi:hypothetical protein